MNGIVLCNLSLWSLTLSMLVVTWALAALEMTDDLRVVGSNCPRLLYWFPSISTEETEKASIKVDLWHVSWFEKRFNLGELPVWTVSGPFNNNCVGKWITMLDKIDKVGPQLVEELNVLTNLLLSIFVLIEWVPRYPPCARHRSEHCCRDCL